MLDPAGAATQLHAGVRSQRIGIFRLDCGRILAPQDKVFHRLGGHLAGVGIQQSKQLR